MCEFIPAKTMMNTLKLAQLSVENVFWLYGQPSNIINDRDKKFDVYFSKAIFRRQATILKLSNIAHPQIDWQTERINQVL